MFIFLTNTPRDYAWGSTQALAEWLGVPETGKPQAELWLGSHPGAPASIAKATPVSQTLIDLINADPEHYGVSGGNLPFLMKVLAIASPLSLQVHPSIAQAEAGFAREEAAGIPRDASTRNYGDPNHKPELLVAVTEVLALSGFRALQAARADFSALAAAAAARGDTAGAQALTDAAQWLTGPAEAARRRVVMWALSGEASASAARAALVRLATIHAADLDLRDHNLADALQQLAKTYPNDQGIIVALLLHVVRLAKGEAIYLGARQLHAYLSGLGVEIMAASDNVLRAGFTTKHIDISELEQVLDYSELEEPRFAQSEWADGVVSWDPPISDFRLLRVNLTNDSADEEIEAWFRQQPPAGQGTASNFVMAADAPLILLVTSGRVRVARQSAEIQEVAAMRRGQCLYVSAGASVELTGLGEVFIGTVGSEWINSQVCRKASSETEGFIISGLT